MKEIYSFHKLNNKLAGCRFNDSTPFPELNFFFIAKNEIEGYIPPNLSLVEGSLPDQQTPKVILVSATGATGKTALALTLSAKNNIPIFDLAKYPPVAARAVTGLLFDEFEPEEGDLFRKGLYEGKNAIIIDAMDEGRVKVNENAFNAFLDDIVKLSSRSVGTPFILLGRNQILEHTYLYFLEKEIEASLLKIEPFTKQQAKDFIDFKVSEEKFNAEYKLVRDFIINSLKSFFDSTSSIANSQDTEYEKFIGYAPVLSAISTLLIKERNYTKLYNNLKDKELEGIDLINTILEYILNREKNEKVGMLILPEMLSKLSNQQKSRFAKQAYNFLEQSSRLIQKELRCNPTVYKTFDTKHVNDEYNEKIDVWVDEHPFRLDGKFQNIVFESYALAQIMANSENDGLASRYLNSRYKGSYLLFLFFEKVAKERKINTKHLNHIFKSLKEIEGANIRAEMIIEIIENNQNEFEGEIEYLINSTDSSTSYSYDLQMQKQEPIVIGGNLGSIKISHPGKVIFKGDLVEFKAPTYVECDEIIFNANEVVFGETINKDIEEDIIFECRDFRIDYEERNNPTLIRYIPKEKIGIISQNDPPYPFYDFASEAEGTLELRAELEPLYRILRRIILSFRSHSKGMLARYKAKIEHRRILKNEMGERILKKLIETGVLFEEGTFYCINPAKLDEHLRINYHDLQRRKVTGRILYFLENEEFAQK